LARKTYIRSMKFGQPEMRGGSRQWENRRFGGMIPWVGAAANGRWGDMESFSHLEPFMQFYFIFMRWHE